MFDRVKEYLKFGAGRPLGTIWAMERSYFQFRRRYPGKEEYAYFRLTLQSRYPDKNTTELQELLSDCQSLDDVMVSAVAVDFGHPIAVRIRMDVLWNLPPCSRCGKYRALSTTDNLCYGCRKFPGFAACTNCRLYWDDSPKFCQRCGGKVWKITDGPGVRMIPLGDVPQVPEHMPAVLEDAQEVNGQHTFEKESDEFVKLVAQVATLEERCARVWDASLGSGANTDSCAGLTLKRPANSFAKSDRRQKKTRR
jgi:hypothetical protein